MSLPVLHFDPLGNRDRAVPAHAHELVGEALATVGAFTIRMRQPEVSESQLGLLLGLFDLPEQSKWRAARRSVRPDSRLEWVGYGLERAGAAILHETFDVGPHGTGPSAVVPTGSAPFQQVTPLPDGPHSGWLRAAEKLRIGLGGGGRELIRLIAEWLGRDEDAAESRFVPDDSTLRTLNYPTDVGEPADGIRAAEHEDSGALTFIWSDLSALEVLTHEKTWVAPPSRTWTVISGHVLSRMTDGVIGPTTHRVCGAQGRRRSLAYFFEPRRSASVLPWPQVGSADLGPRVEEQYGEWLLRRHGA